MAYEFDLFTDNVDDVMAAHPNAVRTALMAHEFLTFKAATEITVASGVLTLTQACHKVQPESGTADDIDTLAGLDAGDMAVLYASDVGIDTLTFKHGTDNISCMGGDDIDLLEGVIFIYFDGTTYYISGGGGGAAAASSGLDDFLLMGA